MTANDGARANNLRTLSQFVTRARRLDEHSLAADRNRLLDWAQGKLTVSIGPSGASMSRELPDEEALSRWLLAVDHLPTKTYLDDWGLTLTTRDNFGVF